MPLPFARKTAPPSTEVAFTIRGTLTLYGRSLAQIQYVTDRYVVTQVDRGIFIFLPDRGERFLVDRGAGRLRRIEPDAQRIRVDRLRAVIGDVSVDADPEAVVVGEYRCRRYRFENANARIVISGETLVTEVAGLQRTALQAERDHDALQQPFSIPMQPDQVVVESRLRTIASEFEQNQAYRLDRVEPGIGEVAEYDRMARLAIIG